MSRSGGCVLPWSKVAVVWRLEDSGSLSLASSYAVVKLAPGEYLSDMALQGLCGGTVGVPLLASAGSFGGADVLYAQLRRGLAEPLGAARELGMALALAEIRFRSSAASLEAVHAARAGDPGTGRFETSQQRKSKQDQATGEQVATEPAAKTRTGEEQELVRAGRIAEAVAPQARRSAPVPPAGRPVAKRAKSPDAGLLPSHAPSAPAAVAVAPVAASAFEVLPALPASVRGDVRSAVLVGVPGVELLLAETSAVRGASVVAALVAGRVGEGVSRRLLDLSNPVEVASFVDSLSASRSVGWTECAASVLSAAASLGTRIALRSEVAS